MYDEYVFKGMRTESDWLHDELFNVFYSDLEAIGPEGVLALRKPTSEKVTALTRALHHFEAREDYEKCGYIKSILEVVEVSPARVVKR